MFDDRMEIYSPGGMYDGLLIQNRDIDNVPSKRRNPIIADIFSRLDYMERRGSGFRKIRLAYEAEPKYSEDKTPVFFSNRTEFRVTLKNLNYSNVKNEVLNDVLKNRNEVLNEVLGETEQQIMKVLMKNPKAGQKEIAKSADVSVSTIQRAMKKLIADNRIERINGKRDGYWKINI